MNEHFLLRLTKENIGARSKLTLACKVSKKFLSQKAFQRRRSGGLFVVCHANASPDTCKSPTEAAGPQESITDKRRESAGIGGSIRRSRSKFRQARVAGEWIRKECSDRRRNSEPKGTYLQPKIWFTRDYGLSFNRQSRAHRFRHHYDNRRWVGEDRV
jgi:hypothetical protein